VPQGGTAPLRHPGFPQGLAMALPMGSRSAIVLLAPVYGAASGRPIQRLNDRRLVIGTQRDFGWLNRETPRALAQISDSGSNERWIIALERSF